MDRSLTEAFSALFSAKFATSFISIVSLPIIVRELGTVGYGNYAFLISTFSLYMILVSSGVTEGVQKFVAERRDDDHWREHVVGFYLRLTLGLGAVGAAVLGVASLSGLPSRLLGPSFSWYFTLLAAFVVAAQLRAFTRRTLMGLGLERYSEPLHVLSKLTWVGLGLSLAAIGLGVDAFLISNIAGAALLAVVGVPYALVMEQAGEAVQPALAAVVYALLVAGILVLPVLVDHVPVPTGQATGT